MNINIEFSNSSEKNRRIGEIGGSPLLYIWNIKQALASVSEGTVQDPVKTTQNYI
jgi:hypothetical protein